MYIGLQNCGILFRVFSLHIAEELWIGLGNKAGVMNAGWPVANKEALKR